MEKKKIKIKSGTKFTILAVILIAIFCIAVTPVTLQNDTYYTIKVGEYISQHGIDMVEHFSWHEGLIYTYPHWLYDLITYFIYSTFGMTGIYVTTCMLSVILGLTLYFTNKKLAKNHVLSFIITIASMYMIKDYIAARAQLVTFILFVLTILFIERFLETKKKRYVAGLIIIPILIANIHAAVFPVYFVLYLPYIAEYLLEVLAEIIIYKKIKIKLIKDKIYIINKKQKGLEKLEGLQKQLKELEEQVDKIKIKRSKELQNPYKIKFVKNNNVKWLILIMIICLFTGLLTPIGDTPYTYLYKTLQGNTTQHINEHMPMTLSDQTGILCAIIVLLSVLTFTNTKIKLSDLFMIGGLAYLMIRTTRQLTMFVIIGSIILNKMIIEMINKYKKLDYEKILKNITKPLVLIAITVIMLTVSYNMYKDKKDDEYVDERDYPVHACDYILENIDLTNARFFNEYNFGSYMVFRGIPVFIDSRADVYDPKFNGKDYDIFMDFINSSSIGVFYEDVMDYYNITHLLLGKSAKMYMIIKDTNDSHYKELYSDDYFVVLERVTE